MANTQYVACTIMAKDKEGRYAFLVKKEGSDHSMPVVSFDHNKTGLACITNRLKYVLTFDVSKLELTELTNAVVNEERIPLFLFAHHNEEGDELEHLIKNDKFTWKYADSLPQILKGWNFTGVPQF